MTAEVALATPYMIWQDGQGFWQAPAQLLLAAAAASHMPCPGPKQAAPHAALRAAELPCAHRAKDQPSSQPLPLSPSSYEQASAQGSGI
jgi:hypothetical protein